MSKQKRNLCGEIQDFSTVGKVLRDKDSTKAFGGYMFVKTYLLSLKYKGDTAEDQIINFIRNNNKRTNE